MKKSKLKEAIKEALDGVGPVIQNCEFNAVKWDAKSLEALNSLTATLELDAKAAIARADTAKAILNLFKSQNVQFDAMLSLQGINNGRVSDSVFIGSK